WRDARGTGARRRAACGGRARRCRARAATRAAPGRHRRPPRPRPRAPPRRRGSGGAPTAAARGRRTRRPGAAGAAHRRRSWPFPGDEGDDAGTGRGVPSTRSAASTARTHAGRRVSSTRSCHPAIEGVRIPRRRPPPALRTGGPRLPRRVAAAPRSRMGGRRPPIRRARSTPCPGTVGEDRYTRLARGGRRMHAVARLGGGTRGRFGRAALVTALAAAALLVASGRADAAPAPTPAANLDQCRNGTVAAPEACTGSSWQNGNLGAENAHYREGDSVPFRAVLTDLSTSGSHTLVIEYDTLAGGKHAYDYLTSYNRTEGSANPCSGITTCVPGAGAAVPADGSIAFANPASTQVAGSISIWNGAITSVAYGGSDAAGKRSVTITFTASASTAVLAWGGHVASQLDWGSGNAAGAISGSPYHMRVLSLDGKGGNQDRSMKS